MPFPAVAGQRVPLNLGDRLTTPRNRVPLNLGVEGGGSAPPVVVIGNVTKPLRSRWSTSASRSRAYRVRWGDAVASARAWRMTMAGMESRPRTLTLPWATPPTVTRDTDAPWAIAVAGTTRSSAVRWTAPPSVSEAVRAVWSNGQLRHAGMSAPWLAPPKIAQQWLFGWAGVESRTNKRLVSRWVRPELQQRHWHIPWGYGSGLEWIVRPPMPPVEPPTDALRDGSRVGLDVACPVFAGDRRRIPLNLGVSACWLARTQRRTYVVLNQIEVVRLPDRLPIHADSVSLAGGRDAWCWDARLSLADPAQLAQLQPTVDGPRSVEISLNGYKWVVAIEAFDKGKVFGAEEVSVSGRSVTAQLADPYAPARTAETTLARTMVQLADAEVDGSAITVSYGTLSWLVPAGAWYYEGLTPMSALVRIAEASGGVVQSHPSDPVVEIRPRYPVSPWAWTTTTPDVTIPDDVVTGTRLQLQSRPMFDAVICAGEHVGVSARVRRDGELGQTYAPQQVDQLLTHADGVRERGRNVLSDRGGQASVDHDLPLFAAPLQPGQPGLVLPLMLARRESAAETWHGLVTAVRIEARRQERAVEIVQTVTIERHYSDAD